MAKSTDSALTVYDCRQPNAITLDFNVARIVGIAKRLCQSPWDAYQVFCFVSFCASASDGEASDVRFLFPSRHVVTLDALFSLPRLSAVRIPHVHPAGSIVPQHAPHLAEYLNHLGDILLRCFLQAELLVNAGCAAIFASAGINTGALTSRDCTGSLAVLYLATYAMVTIRIPAFPLTGAIISQAPIRRAGHAAVHRSIPKPAQLFQHVARKNPPGGGGLPES